MDLLDDFADHVYEDLHGYWQPHSYYQSRARIVERFPTGGPFPSLTSFNSKEDPQTSLTRKFVDELQVATRNFKEKTYAKYYQHLATNKLKKINTLVQEAKAIYNNMLVQDTLQRTREQAFNNAREIKQKQKQNQNQH